MAETKRTFIAGKMNMDIDERMLPDGQYRSASNITVESTGGSNVGAVQNALGNERLFNVADFLSKFKGITITGAKTIGAVKYEPLSLLYWFVTSNEFDGIFEYNQKTNKTSLILGSTTDQLKFDALALITGVNYIYSDEGSYLFWTDNLNPPRRINITRVREYSVDDTRINIDIDVILRPPLNSPKIVLGLDSDPSTNLEEKFLYFSYRYKYIDNEFSSMAPFSALAFDAKSLSFDPNTGDNVGMLNKYNLVNIHFETGNEFVKEIQILVRDTRSLNVMIVETLNKVDEVIPNNSTSSFVFRNNKIYTTLTSDQVTRMFDNVPLKAQAQEIIGNRLIYGNYTQFRDVPSLNYSVDFGSYKYTPEELLTTPKPTFRSDRDYEVGIVYGDEYGRLTTVLTSKQSNTSNSSSNSIYIPPANSSTANLLKTTIKSLPPSWATNYRLYIKQAKKEYYNLFPISFQISGQYRYLQISESERDKVSVGQYIIFKTANTTATHSNKKFKVLEIELKTLGQINAGSPAGLYIKIKPDAISNASFFVAPIANTQQSPVNPTIGQDPVLDSLISYGQCLNPSSNKTQEPYSVNSFIQSNLHENGLFYDTVHYRLGSDFFTASQNGAAILTMVATANGKTFKRDLRLKVKIVNDPANPNSSTATHFSLNSNVNDQNNWSYPTAITSVQPGGLNVNTNANGFMSSQNTPVRLYFPTVGTYTLGDVYVFNVRARVNETSPVNIRIPSAAGNHGLPLQPFSGSSQKYDISENFSSDDYKGTCVVGLKGPIYTGAIIKITLKEFVGDSDTDVNSAFVTTTAPSSRMYPSFEEYWYEEFIFSGQDLGGGVFSKDNAAFRYCHSFTYSNGGPSGQTMGQGTSEVTLNGIQNNYYSTLFYPANANKARAKNSPFFCKRSKYTAEVSLTQSLTPKYIFETEPIEVDTDIFYETTKTYPIINNFHKVGWNYQTATGTAVTGGFNILLTSTGIHYFNPADYVWRNGVSHNVVAVTSQRQITIFSTTNFSGSGTIYSTLIESDQTSSTDATVVLNNGTQNTEYNAFCYGNGLESDRIRDSFNNTTIKYSIRASSIIDDYEQEDKFASLTYSGIYRGDSSINRLNEFNLSLANFKNLDKEYGSIQKLYARDSDLLVLHQDKITSVLFGKNLLVDALGGGQVASIPEVLGNQVPYQLDNGISNDPASFAVNSDNIYFTDAKRGVVIEMIGNQGIMEISSRGMRNYFRDTLTSNINTQKIGAYDPYYNMYSLTTNETSNRKCILSLSKLSTTFSNKRGTTSKIFLFNILSIESWTIELIDNGFGTDWLVLNFNSGTGAQNITAYPQNISNSLPRNMTVRVSYCGSTIDHLVTEITYKPIIKSVIIVKSK